MKVLIFDASTLITFAMNGLLKELAELKKSFKGKFIIPEEVKNEIIDKPLKIKRFELEALQIKELLDNGILEKPSILNVDEKRISKDTIKLMRIANKIFQGRGRDIKLISSGETACLALSRILDEKKIENIIAVDERTTRMLAEKPENLENLLRKKLHTDVHFNEKNFKPFQGFKFIRSSELVYIMYKKGIIKLKDSGRVLDALLYAVKFKGCAISGDEIREIKRMK